MSGQVVSQHSPQRIFRAYRVTLEVIVLYLGNFFARRFLSREKSQALTNRCHKRASQIITSNILKLKGLYIKIGQTLSIMTNFLPEEFREGFEKLQDAVPPHSYEDIEERFKQEFNKLPLEVFATFEKEPIASASLGQVHIATMRDGRKVAVKLQYPAIDRLVEKDLRTIKKIFWIIDLFLPQYQFMNVYHECARMIVEELDYKREGKNLESVQKNFPTNSKFHFPTIFWDLTTSKVLTTEYIDGIKVSNLSALSQSALNPHEVAVTLIHGYCKMIFEDGLYHADPHPGNILIVPSPVPQSGPSSPTGGEGNQNFQVTLIDFGAIGSVPSHLREGMILFVEALIKKDTRLISSAMKQMGFIAREESEEAFDKIVDYFYSKIRTLKIEDFREIKIADFQHIDDLFELAKMDLSFKEILGAFHVPKDWVLLERTLLLVLGIVTHLDPKLNPADIVIPYVEEFILGKERKMTDMIVMGTKELLLSYINLPTELMKILKKLDQGKLSFSDKLRRKDSERIYRGIHQLIFALLGTYSLHMANATPAAASNNWQWMAYLWYSALLVSWLRAK